MAAEATYAVSYGSHGTRSIGSNFSKRPKLSMAGLHHHNIPRRSGFSLIELVVVVLILGIVTSVTLPRLSGSLDRHYLKSVGSKLVSELRVIQSRAVREGKRFRVVFNTSGNVGYQVQVIPTSGTAVTDSSVNLSSLFRGTAIDSVAFGSSAQIDFDEYGLMTPKNHTTNVSRLPEITLGCGSLNVAIPLSDSLQTNLLDTPGLTPPSGVTTVRWGTRTSDLSTSSGPSPIRP